MTPQPEQLPEDEGSGASNELLEEPEAGRQDSGKLRGTARGSSGLLGAGEEHLVPFSNGIWTRRLRRRGRG